jgi:hypothetical protein
LDADGGASPQLGGVGVPQNRTFVVEAVEAKRFAEASIVGLVDLMAADVTPVVASVAPIRVAPSG